MRGVGAGHNSYRSAVAKALAGLAADLNCVMQPVLPGVSERLRLQSGRDSPGVLLR